jgi:hypothetical protein
MITIPKQFLVLITCLLGAIVVSGTPVLAYHPEDILTLQFAAHDIRQACLKQGNQFVLMPLTLIPEMRLLWFDDIETRVNGSAVEVTLK